MDETRELLLFAGEFEVIGCDASVLGAPRGRPLNPGGSSPTNLHNI